MLKRLEKFFKDNIQDSDNSNPASSGDRIKVATTVLFLEMAYADFEIDPQEEHEIKSALHDLFDIDETEITGLIQDAKIQRASKNDIWNFTNSLKSEFDKSERLEILDRLWQLVFADGRVDKYEDALIRKITTLLGLEHGDMIQSKLKTQNLLNQ